MLSKAIAMAAAAFQDKKDKGGKPYILHCLRVMNDVDQADEALMCIAVLHDLLEDCPERLEEFTNANFGSRIVRAIQTLTHHETDSYDDYIERIALNEDARIVKLADLKDNSNITRLKGMRKKDFDRMKKYHRAFIYLSQ